MVSLLKTVISSRAQYNKAVAIWKELNNRSSHAMMLYGMASVFTELGDYQKAIESYEQATKLSESIKDVRQGVNELLLLRVYDPSLFRFLVTNRFRTIAKAYIAVGQQERAIKLLEEAISNSKENKIAGSEGDALQGLGNVYRSLKQYDKALSSYEQALAVFRKLNFRLDQGEALNELGITHLELNDFEKARTSFDQALVIFHDLKDNAGEADTLSNLGEVCRREGQYEKAFEHLTQALALRQAIKDPLSKAASLNSMMLLWKTADNSPLAILFGKQAVNAYQEVRQNIRFLERVSQRSFIKSKEQTYRDLADLLISLGRLPEAQQALALLKEEEYFDFIRRRSDNPSSLSGRADLTAQEAAAVKRFDLIADRITAIGTRLQELSRAKNRTPQQEAELERLKADLSDANRVFGVTLREIAQEFKNLGDSRERARSLEESRGLRSDLREWSEGAVVLTTVVTENGYRVIVTTPTVQVARRFDIGEARLNRLVLEFREALQNPRIDPRPLGQRLYSIMVGPIEKDLEGAKARTLVWSLDGSLRYLPVAALYDGKKYLAEKYANVIITLASRTRLAELLRGRWRGLGMGVSKEWPGFKGLPAVAEELRGIIRDEKESPEGVLQGRILLDGSFTAKAMSESLREKYPVVHIASHFVFRPGNESDSYLLLGDGTKLSLDEIRNAAELQFEGVQLLTLSACDTATGGAGNGREIEGFAVLAQAQGAKAVMATLWAVADRSTSKFMQEFYRQRENNPSISKTEAMRRAQLILLYGEQKGAPSQPDRGPRVVSAQSSDKLPEFKPDPKAPYSHPYYWAPFVLIGNWK